MGTSIRTDRRPRLTDTIRNFQQPNTTSAPATTAQPQQPAQPQPVTTTNDAPSDGTSSTSPRPTLATSLEGRRVRGADPIATQLRARADATLAGTNDGLPGAIRNRPEGRRPFGLATEPTPAGGTSNNTQPGFSQNSDGSYTYRGTSGDDRLAVTHRADGSLVVRNEATGTEETLTGAQAANGVTIETGDGHDAVTVQGQPPPELPPENEAGASLGQPKAAGLGLPIINVDLGAGSDRVDARGWQGASTLSGGEGDDELLGGSGADDIYGGAGNDHLHGGAGMDMVAGGAGNDDVSGDAGNDQVLGQEGDDRVAGNEGDDFVQGGAGADRLRAGAGVDAVYADAADTSVDAGADQDADTIIGEEGGVAPSNLYEGDVEHRYDPKQVDEYLAEHPELVINGSDDFAARTRADLGVMLTTEQGRGLLNDVTAALREQGETLTFEEKEEGAGGSYDIEGNVVESGSWAESYDDGSTRVPLPVTFHELVHAYQDLVSGFPEGETTFENGRSANNLERQAVGLPWIDSEGNMHPADELPYTDNAFRRELGLPERTTYSGESGAPQGYAEDEGGHAH